MKNGATRYLRKAAAVLTAAAALASCQQMGPNVLNDVDLARAKIAPNLLQLGARNWVVVADPAARCLRVRVLSASMYRPAL